MGEPTHLPRNPISRPTFKGAPPNQVFLRNDENPASVALVARGARIVGPRESRMLDGDGRVGTPLATLPFGVRVVDNMTGKHAWRNLTGAI